MVKEVRRISIRPHLEEQKSKRSEGDRYLRENIAKGNTGSIYTHLYAALFNGVPSQRYKGNHDTLPNGEKRIIHPDITRATTSGLDNIEVKAVSYSDGRALVSIEQIENYFYLLSERLFIERDKLPEVEVGIFRYGGTMPSFLFGYNTKRFVDIVTKTTRDLVVMPSNLFLFAALCAQKSSKDKSTSKSQTKCVAYHRIPEWFLTTLNSSDNPLADLSTLATEGYKEIFTRATKTPTFVSEMTPEERAFLINEYLCLDKLKFKRFSSGDIAELRCRHFKFKPFEITRIFMKKKDRFAWLQSFRKNHRYFLEELLGVRDLYYENYERSDASEEGLPEGDLEIYPDEELPF